MSKAVGYDVYPIEHEDTFFLIVEKHQVILYGNVYDVKNKSFYLAFGLIPTHHTLRSRISSHGIQEAARLYVPLIVHRFSRSLTKYTR